jgi:alpha-ketoglutarate-dependent taurine dioxygenase
LPETATLPETICATAARRDLNAWFERNCGTVDAALQRSGGLLFRGFDVPDAAAFQRFAERHIPGLLPYTERSTPRTQVGRRVYTSTEYPPDQVIAMHNEFSYALRWPMRICFYCQCPASEGGETPLADGREIYRRISANVRERFEDLGVRYVRRYGWGVDLSWQEAFNTESKENVEEHCRANRIEFEWVDGNKLLTRQVRQGVTTHPRTGEKVWFNQAHLFHVSNLPAAARISLERLMDDHLPREAFYGDGSPIADEALAEVRRAFAEATVTFPWEQGDVLLLDNVLINHGRRPFRGERKVLVAMGDSFPPDSASGPA